MTRNRGYTWAVRLLLLLALLPGLVGLTGCAGGCGEPEPGTKGSSASGGAGPGAGPTGGGGSVAIESERAARAPRAPKAPAASAGKGVPDDGSTEYSAAGKPVEPQRKKAGPPRLVAACRSHDPGCDDLRAALSLARQDWGASVAVDQRPAAGPSLKLFAGDKQVSERLGLPFAQDKGLETEADYRRRLAEWLSKAVRAGDLSAAP